MDRVRIALVLTVAVLMLGLASAGHSDVVVPSERIVTGVNIRAQPDGDSSILGLLTPGDQLPHRGSVPHWNRVRLPDGRDGYVSSSWTKVIHDEEAPVIPEEEQPAVSETPAPAPESTSDGGFDFWLSEDLVRKLADQNTIDFSLRLNLTERSGLHDLGSDCELHIAGTPIDISDEAAPPSFVVEPPNLCKHTPPGGGSWTTLVTDSLLDQVCTVHGFPRIWDEHLVGNETPTNPHHMLEIHPALKIECDNGGELDASTFIDYFDGMSEIQPNSVAKCFDTKLWVRRNTQQNRYEFRAERHRFCGNFASFEYSIFDEWIRVLPHGGHSALIRVRPEGLPTKTLKIYTYPGTKADDLLEGFVASTDPQDGGVMHGMLTFDYFAIVKTVRNRDGSFKPVQDWTEVRFPLALVAFGPKEDLDPDEHE